VRLYRIEIDESRDVSGVSSLEGATEPLTKELVVDLGALGVPLENLEGMTFGPPLPDGRRLLVLVSDNNFDAPRQRTLFLFLALDG